MADLTGQVLGRRYQVREFIGRGGVAEVYRAWDARRGIEVALKFLREDLAEDRSFLRRFQREAQVLEKLRHPNIVRYYGFEEIDGYAFLVMEFIQGVSLRKYLYELGRPLTVGEALTVLQPVCKALHYAHSERVLHCDVKPGNILLERGGRVVLTDFGIARWAESGSGTVTIVGTPAYMAPEQIQGQGLGVWTDVYGLGATLYEMLTLRRPFPGEKGKGTTGERVLWEQMYAEPRPMRDHNPRVPAHVDEVVRRALRKEPKERPKDVMEVLQGVARGVTPEPLKGLEAVEKGRLEERQATVIRWGFRGVWPVIGAAILAVVLMVGVLTGGGGGTETRGAEMTRGAERGTATAVAATVRAVQTKVAEMTRGAEMATAAARARATESARAATQAAQTATAQAEETFRARTATAQAAQVSRAQTATAEASRQRCFEAVRRHWEASASGLGEVGGVVLDMAGRPFTSAQVRLQIEESDFIRFIGISPDGMYNFCCLSLGTNWHIVDLVGTNITSTPYKFQTPGWEGKARVLVDFKEVPCR